VIVQEVHLVDVQNVPVRLPSTPSRTSGSPPQRRLQVQAPHNPVLDAFNARSTTSTGRDSIPQTSPDPSAPGTRRTTTSPERTERQPDTTSFGGRTAANDRTAVVFPVPFSPRSNTPPIDGSTAFTRRPFFNNSWPTKALKEMCSLNQFTVGRNIPSLQGLREEELLAGGKRLHQRDQVGTVSSGGSPAGGGCRFFRNASKYSPQLLASGAVGLQEDLRGPGQIPGVRCPDKIRDLFPPVPLDLIPVFPDLF